MKLNKTTIEKCEKAGFRLYNAKKETTKTGSWITVRYAVIYNQTTVSTEQTETFEGSEQQDIVNFFCNR